MNLLRPSNSLAVIFTASALIAGTAGAFAADQPASPPAPTQEMRQQMAAVHEKMAACLRSDKPFAECRNEMHQNCQTTMGKQSCPMMGMGMPMHNRMMKQPTDSGR